MSKVRYQIVKLIPHYNDYDAISAYSYLRFPYAYETKELALKIASNMQYEDETPCYVVEYGKPVEKRIYNFDFGYSSTLEMPF